MSEIDDFSRDFLLALQHQLQHGYTKYGIARESDVSRSYLYELLKFRRNVGIDTARRIANAAGITIQYKILVDAPISSSRSP